MKQPPAYYFLLLVLLSLAPLLTGCRGSNADLPERVLKCAQLEGAKSSKLPELVEAVQQIERRQAGPLHLSRPAKGPDLNAAARLAEVFSDADRLRLFSPLRTLVTPGAEDDSEAQLAMMRKLLEDEQEILAAVNQAVELPDCSSGVRFDLGFFDRYKFLDDAAIATRLHLTAAVVAFADEERPLGMRQAAWASQWIGWLAKEQRLEARLLAAQLRREWFELVRSVVSHSATREELSTFFTALRQQLNEWPPDRATFVGDRAITLHAYEAVRAGMADRVITIDEKKALKKANWLEKTKTIDGPSLDRDELIYLGVMQEVIDACSDPYYQRVERLAPLFEDHAIGSERSEQAPYATRLFLPGVAEALEWIARDRALTEAWALAIASAAPFDIPPYRISPLNGRAYEAERLGDGVLLKLGDLESPDPFVVKPRDGSGAAP